MLGNCRVAGIALRTVRDFAVACYVRIAKLYSDPAKRSQAFCQGVRTFDDVLPELRIFIAGTGDDMPEVRIIARRAFSSTAAGVSIAA
jgi:hypothetical protein